MTHSSSTNDGDRIRGGLALLTTIWFTEIPRLCLLTIPKVVSKRVLFRERKMGNPYEEQDTDLII